MIDLSFVIRNNFVFRIRRLIDRSFGKALANRRW